MTALRKLRLVAVEDRGQILVAVGRKALHGLGLALELDGFGIRDVEAGLVQAHVRAQLPGQQGMLFGGIAADEKNGRSGGDVAQAGGLAVVAGEGAGKGGEVGGALVVDVVGLENRACEFLQEIVLFVGGLVGADDGDRRAAAAVADFLELARGEAQGVFPGGRF